MARIVSSLSFPRLRPGQTVGYGFRIFEQASRYPVGSFTRVRVQRQPLYLALRVPSATRLDPRPGTRVARGSVVTITPGFGPVGSPAVLKSHPHYEVPSFIGRPAGSAVAWAEAHTMFWAIRRLPPLPASNAPHLLDAYRVVIQRPTAGGTIVQGVMRGAPSDRPHSRSRSCGTRSRDR